MLVSLTIPSNKQYQVKVFFVFLFLFFVFKEWTDNVKLKKKKKLYKCIMANTSAIWQQAAHTTYQLSSPSCSTGAIQKGLTGNEKYLSFLEREKKEKRKRKKSQENGPLAEKLQGSKRTRQKKTREEIGKGNQMTALKFQTGGWHQTSRPPFGIMIER